jgi:hypothetical protein
LRILFSEIASLRSVHDDMNAKPCDRCTTIMVNYADLWLIHSHVAGLLDSARLELRELKARSTLLGACTSCSLLRSDSEAAAIEIKDLKHKFDHSSSYTVLSPPCEACVSLKGKLFHVTKENTELQQEVAYLTTRLEKTMLSEKMIEEDLSRVEESATKPHTDWVLGLRDVRRKVRRVLLCLFLAPATTKKRKHSNQPKPITHPIQSHPSTQREVRKETPKPREEAFICMFCGRAHHLDEFFFRRKRIERRRVEYARDSYRDEFIDFPSRSYSHVPPRFYSRASPRTFSRVLPRTSSSVSPQFAHGSNHHSYGFGP